MRFLSARYGASNDDAVEYAQKAWVQGFESRMQLRNPELVLYWVNRIAGNFYLASFRNRTKTLVEVGENTFSQRVESKIILDQIRAVLDGDDLLLFDYLVRGDDYEEIHKALAINRSTLRLRIHRLKKHIHRRLEKKIFT